MRSPANARKPLRADGRTDMPQNGHGWSDGPTNPCTVGKGYFRLRTDGQTDGQSENIMPPAPKGGGIKIWQVFFYAQTTIIDLGSNDLKKSVFLSHRRAHVCTNPASRNDRECEHVSLNNSACKKDASLYNLKMLWKSMKSDYLNNYTTYRRQRNAITNTEKIFP